MLSAESQTTSVRQDVEYSSLAADPRWRRVHERTWICPGCGNPHGGVFDLACGKPESWDGSEEKSPNSAVATESHFLSQDFCVETFDSADQGSVGPWFGWFSNRLKGYSDTLNLKCQVHPRSGRQRPWIELEPTNHPLALEQREGMTFDRLLEIYALNGHDIRSALAD